MRKNSVDHGPAAHNALRELWELSDQVLRERGETTPYGLVIRGDYEEGDPTIMRVGNLLEVSGQFERDMNGVIVNEDLRVEFPEDIRSMLASQVTIDWFNTETQDSGTNTVPRKKIPEVAGQLIGLIEFSYLPEAVR